MHEANNTRMERTCSFLQQGLCVQLSDQPSTPFPWQFAGTCPGELTEHGKSVVNNFMLLVWNITHIVHIHGKSVVNIIMLL